MPRFKLILILVMLLLFAGPAWAGTIISVAKKYVVANYSIEEISKEIYFDLSQLKQVEGYAVLNSPVYHTDGSETTSHIEDLVYVLCLEQGQDGLWRIVYDFSRSDVPSTEELKVIRSSFPKEFPQKLLPPFWQQLLK